MPAVRPMYAPLVALVVGGREAHALRDGGGVSTTVLRWTYRFLLVVLRGGI